MGVDAEMIVRTKSEVTPEKLRYWSYVFGSAYSHYLMLGIRDQIWHRPIELLEKQEYPNRTSENKLPDETDLHIPLSGRYYGKGYERGPLFVYIGIAEFLEELIPQSRIFYGGDSGEYLYPFNKKERDELKIYYIESAGHDKYVRAFDREDRKDAPKCPVCEVKMYRNGWGPNYALYTCGGCGWIHSIKDGIIKNGFGND